MSGREFARWMTVLRHADHTTCAFIPAVTESDNNVQLAEASEGRESDSSEREASKGQQQAPLSSC